MYLGKSQCTLIIHNDTYPNFGADHLCEDIINMATLITIEQVPNMHELLCQNGGDDQEMLNIQMMYYEYLKNSIVKDMMTSTIAAKYKDIINKDGTMFWKVLMDNLTNKATKQQVHLWKATLRTLKMVDSDNNVKVMNANNISKIVLYLNNAEVTPIKRHHTTSLPCTSWASKMKLIAPTIATLIPRMH
jgi:hypothetical protein